MPYPKQNYSSPVSNHSSDLSNSRLIASRASARSYDELELRPLDLSEKILALSDW